MIKFCNRNKISFLATKYIYLQLFQYKNIDLIYQIHSGESGEASTYLFLVVGITIS